MGAEIRGGLVASSRLRSVSVAAAILLGLGIIFIGARFLADPATAASGFGVAARPDDPAYLMAKGLRDCVLGLSGLTLIALGHRRAAGWLLLVVALVPAGDAVIVLAYGGSVAIAGGVHGVTAVVLLLVGATLVRTASR